MAVANYHDHHGYYPPAYLADAEGCPMHSWRVLLLPYLEGDQLYEDYDFSGPWNGPSNRRLAPQMPKVHAFHGEDWTGNTTTNYLAVVGPQTAWPAPDRISAKEVKDGSSATILLVENRGAGVHWMEPRDLEFASMSFAINSPAGVSSRYADPAVVMLDGSVHRLRKGLSPATLRALLTANGGEEIRGYAGYWELLPDGRQREPAAP